MGELVLTLDSVNKSAEGVKVINDLNFALESGEIHVLLGLNGTGKTTLVNILAGIQEADSGMALLRDRAINLAKAKMSPGGKIGFVFEEPFLFPFATVIENIIMGQMVHSVFFDGETAHNLTREAASLLEDLDFDLDPDAMVFRLNLAQRRMVEIARVFFQKPDIIIMDEPFESLSNRETASVVKALNYFKAQGTAMLITSQRFERILDFADKVSILFDGHVFQFGLSACTRLTDIMKVVCDGCFDDPFPKIDIKKGPTCLNVNGLCVPGKLREVSFSLRESEILGVYGTVGSGRTTLAQTIFGANDDYSGDITLWNRSATIRSSRDAINNGIAYIPDDRASIGLFENMNTHANLVSSPLVSSRFICNPHLEERRLLSYLKKMKIDRRHLHSAAGDLSAGLCQKILLLKWIISSARIYIFDEPTKNLDISAKYEFYNIINDLIQKRAAVILISSDIFELIGMCDRILFMKEGSLSYEMKKSEFSMIDLGNT
jgi:ribose transport system ATP-binding protein